jgi:hypothetical protein
MRNPLMTLNELKLEIADILEEAKKKKVKSDDLKKKGAAIEAFGLHDEAFDFSDPLGDSNLLKRQGGVNWGPYTNGGSTVDSQFDDPNTGHKGLKEEAALRAVVRDVIKNGLIPEHSAWAPLLKKERARDGVWGEATAMFEAWYDKFDKSDKKGLPSKDDGKNGYGPVKKHGQEKKKGKK